MGGRTLHHRHVRTVLPQRGTDVEGRVVGPDDHARFPRYASGPGWADEWCWSPRNRSMPGKDGRLGLPDMPVARTSCAGRNTIGWPSRSTLHCPLAGRLVVGRALGLGIGPVVELHDLRVGLQPVGDLVLGREDRPAGGELQIRQVVVPDRVVQAEGLVAAAPLVTGTAFVDDDRGHAELTEPGAEGDAALAAANDQHVRLLGEAEFGRLVLAFFQPGRASAVRAVLHALRTAQALRLLVALEFVEGGQQRPATTAAQAQIPASSADRGLELDPRLNHPAGVGGFLTAGDLPVARLHPSQRLAEHPVIAALPSKVLMFQVNAMRSRQ